MSAFTLLPNAFALAGRLVPPTSTGNHAVFSSTDAHVEGLAFDDVFDYRKYVAGEAARLDLRAPQSLLFFGTFLLLSCDELHISLSERR